MSVKTRLRKGGFFSRRWEIVFGFVFVIVGSYLLWDAFDNRGKKLPWPLSGLAPW